MFDISALGEALIDFIDITKSGEKKRIFEQNAGGAPANVVCGASRLGLKTAFIGKVGCDMHGEFLKKTLDSEGVYTGGLVFDRSVFTTLAFVSHDGAERIFSFARHPGADTCLKKEELCIDIIKNSKIFHFGSLSMTHEPSCGATIEAVSVARGFGSIISYDPNYRAPLWESEEAAARIMRRPVHMVNIIKISEEECFLMTGHDDYKKAARRLIREGVSICAVTLGEKGVYIATEIFSFYLPAYKVEAVDTTGAGDAFFSAFLYGLLSIGRIKHMTAEKLKDVARFALASGALTVTKRGAIPAMSTKEEIEKFIKSCGI